MTGYGRATVQEGNVACTVEIRSVNNRFLKLSLRLPDALAALEMRAEKLVRDSFVRGTVGVTVRLEGLAGSSGYRINAVLFQEILDQLGKLLGEKPDQKMTAALLGNPELFERVGDSVDESSVWPIVEKGLHAALAECQQMRSDEGLAMARELESLVADADTLVTSISGRSALAVSEYHERLIERIRTLLARHHVELDQRDVIREAAVLAERLDIAEELARLRSHLNQVSEAVRHGESAGRKLDFLAQELNREANTISAKANDLEIANWVVDLKTRIERIRELVQNVE
jgi:uncharacterized protein (TIGR00255 family)